MIPRVGNGGRGGKELEFSLKINILRIFGTFVCTDHLFPMLLNNILDIDDNLFKYSLMEILVGSFHFSTVINTATMNFHLKVIAFLVMKVFLYSSRFFDLKWMDISAVSGL